MKLFKKISIFVVVALMICSVLSISAFAEGESETETSAPINVKDYVLGVHCPNCEEQGLKYNGEYFTCQDEDCGYMYAIECSICGGNDFALREDGLYECLGENCDNVLSLGEVQESLKLSKKPAGGKLDQNLHGGDMGFGERFEYAIQGTVTGMLMVFAVLGLLFGIVSLSKVFLYDIPNRDKNKGKKENKSASVETPAPVAVAESAPAVEESADDGELAAVITAAIAAMLDSEEYKNEFVGGFRVVSFKRSANSAWNKK